jgi:hypothetical protein
MERVTAPSLGDWLEPEEPTAPWCIDHGERIEVMPSADVRLAWERGQLAKHVKVWREGNACWVPIAEAWEILDDPPPRRSVRSSWADGPVSAPFLLGRPRLLRGAGRTWLGLLLLALAASIVLLVGIPLAGAASSVAFGLGGRELQKIEERKP